jgi:hypothetical protein
MKYLKKYKIFETKNWGKIYSDLVIGAAEQIKLENDLDETLEDFKDLITDLSDYGSRTEINNYLVIDSKIGRPNQPRKASGLKKLRIEEIEYTGVYNHWIEASTSINKLLKFKQDLYWELQVNINESCKIGSHQNSRVNKEIKKEFEALKLNLESRGWQLVDQYNGIGKLGEFFIIDLSGTFAFDVRIKVDYNNLNEWILENYPEILK